jgi:hypothetical protein
MCIPTRFRPEQDPTCLLAGETYSAHPESAYELSNSGKGRGSFSWVPFSILTRRLLRHGQFSDPDDLATQMLAFVEHYNLTAKPFAWTYSGKVLVA